MTETLAQRIMRHEGFAEFPKPDAKKFWVIGYGHDISQAAVRDYADGITESAAIDLLNADIARFEAETAEAFPWSSGLSPTRLGVLAEMVFQMGVEGVSEFRDFLRDLEAGHYALAAHEMLASEWDEETPARCEELANLILNDNQPEDALPWLTKGTP